MRQIAVIIFAVGMALGASADKKGTLEELKNRVGHADTKERIELSVEIAERQLKAADDAYTAGNTEAAQAALADIVEYGVRAAKDSTNSGKRMKQTEIALRKISDRLDNIGKSIEVENRPPVRDALGKLEAARNDLLFRMFK